ncbi:MAG: PD-(D/E)XK nuclease family protein [Clostridium sp.]|uniref:PDDEXK-like family protein n=1 Tax=Clostridium sp. TaxID=1506 RepID=UPI003F3D4E98
MKSDRQCIEEFLMDIDELDKINSRVLKFNVFEILEVVNAEIKHSNMLGWLFDPNENHGLNDVFIKKFIQKIFYNYKEKLQEGDKRLDFLDISLMEYHDFIIRREYRNIDLLLYSELNNIVVVIENKIWSKESSHQLKKYRDIIEEEFKGYKKINIFLSPFGEEPSDMENWIICDYTLILEILKKSKEIKKETLGNSVWDFLEQYEEMLRRYIVRDNELEVICKDIYYKHKRALDLIFEYKPDIYLEISEYLTDKISKMEERGEGLIIDKGNKTYIRFATEIFDKKIEKKGKGWTATNRILLYEFQQKSEKLALKLIIGPAANNEIREKIYKIYEENRDVFNRKTKLTGEYTTIYSKEFMMKNFVDKYDGNYSDIIKEIDKKFEHFIEGDFKKIDKIFDDIKGYI